MRYPFSIYDSLIQKQLFLGTHKKRLGLSLVPVENLFDLIFQPYSLPLHRKFSQNISLFIKADVMFAPSIIQDAIM